MQHRVLVCVGGAVGSGATLGLAQLGDWRAASLNVSVTTILCLALCVAGMALGRLLTR